jgi:hypothetical protein
MTFFINAWLERKNPFLELRESTTNRMIYHVEGEVLNDWLNQGELTLTDLTNIDETHELVRDLLLKSITDNVSSHRIASPTIYNVVRNNVIRFPRKFRKPSEHCGRLNLSTHNISSNISNKVVYLHSLLSKRLLKYIDNAIY